MMTLKEAVLQSLDEIKGVTNYLAVYQHIVKTGIYDFKNAKTPASTVSATLGFFIRNGDSRVKRIKQEGGSYSYYLAKNESNIPFDVLSGENSFLTSADPMNDVKREKKRGFSERSLHMLLSSYLKNRGTYSKTIFHEKSTSGRGNNQIWTHPDMVGVRFLSLQNKSSQHLLKSINKADTFKISSYELKKEINSDSELKKAFFQAVSNSSWANYGYLVAFEFSDNLIEEIERLNQSFGIGVIELDSNPFKSKVLFPARYRELDFKTIDKLSTINRDIESFIEQTEKLMTAEERYFKAIEKEFTSFCDACLTTDTEIAEYCLKNDIPHEIEDSVAVLDDLR
jgi:uncharacterized protein